MDLARSGNLSSTSPGDGRAQWLPSPPYSLANQSGRTGNDNPPPYSERAPLPHGFHIIARDISPPSLQAEFHQYMMGMRRPTVSPASESQLPPGDGAPPAVCIQNEAVVPPIQPAATVSTPGTAPVSAAPPSNEASAPKSPVAQTSSVTSSQGTLTPHEPALTPSRSDSKALKSFVGKLNFTPAETKKMNNDSERLRSSRLKRFQLEGLTSAGQLSGPADRPQSLAASQSDDSDGEDSSSVRSSDTTCGIVKCYQYDNLPSDDEAEGTSGAGRGLLPVATTV